MYTHLPLSSISLLNDNWRQFSCIYHQAYTSFKHLSSQFSRSVIFPPCDTHILKCDNRECDKLTKWLTLQSFFKFYFTRDALTGSNTSTILVLDKFNYKFNVDYDDDDIKVIQYVTALVSYRAALLVSICTAVLLNRMSEKEITIAVDGSVYKHHPRLKKWMKQLIKELAPEKEVSAFPLLITLSHPISYFSL